MAGQLRLYAPDRCFVLQPLAGLAPTTAEGSRIKESVILRREPVAWFGVVWPYGATVVHQGGRYGVKTRTGATYWAGDVISGGGGTWPDDDTYGLPDACLGHYLNQIDPQ
ncbi:MAG: hypothetical protein ACT4QF_19960 [Sporichthyaceae bacterium]